MIPRNTGGNVYTKRLGQWPVEIWVAGSILFSPLPGEGDMCVWENEHQILLEATCPQCVHQGLAKRGLPNPDVLRRDSFWLRVFPHRFPKPQWFSEALHIVEILQAHASDHSLVCAVFQINFCKFNLQRVTKEHRKADPEKEIDRDGEKCRDSSHLRLFTKRIWEEKQT